MKTFLLALLAYLLLFASGCASIVSYSNYPLTINTTPANLTVTITDRDGVVFFRGKSPATVSLKSGHGFFKAAQYFVKIEGPGITPRIFNVDCELDPWYFGNILLGGVIGMLIVDPATGAMYMLSQEYLDIEVENQTTDATPKLQVWDLPSIPPEWHAHLEEIVK